MSQYTASSSLYTLSSAGRSNTSIDSCSSYASSSSPVASFESASSVHVSQSVSRIVPKSSLAQRIADARKQKAASIYTNSLYEVEVEAQCAVAPVDETTRRERITAKFLENEKQWKIDACIEKDKRVAQALQSLGF